MKILQSKKNINILISLIIILVSIVVAIYIFIDSRQEHNHICNHDFLPGATVTAPTVNELEKWKNN